jgi:hypothetical protein
MKEPTTLITRHFCVYGHLKPIEKREVVRREERAGGRGLILFHA